MNRLKRLCALALPLLIAAPVQAIKVHTIGDSTMATYDESSTVTRGWGQMLQQFFKGELSVNNRAKSGSSTKSFYQGEAYWASVKKQIEAGDYVFIQFAHNDEKNNGMDGDELIAYYKSIGDETTAAATDFRGTTPSGTYKEYLRKYVNETRELGGTPILVAPICRKYFTGSTIRRNGRHDLGDNFKLLTSDGVQENQSVGQDDHSMDYVYQMQLVAEELDVPFIDLTTATKKLYESYGDTQANTLLFDGNGSTHTSGMGATLIARLCAQLLQAQGILTDYINLTSDLTVNPSAIDLGEAYVGQTLSKEVYVSGFDLTPASGTITVTATGALELSADGENYSNSLTLSYEGGNMVESFTVRCACKQNGTISETVTLSTTGKTIDIAVSGTVISLAEGTEAQVYWRLETDDKATVTGPVNAEGETLSGMYVQKYANPNANTTWPDFTGFEATRKTQRCLIVGDTWPEGEIDEVSTRYIEFAATPAAGTTLNIDCISLFVCGCGGNGMCCKIYYSKEADFANPVNIYEAKKMTANAMQYVVSQRVLKVNDGETLRLRIYPWYNNSATGKTLCISDVTFHGVAVSQSADAVKSVMREEGVAGSAVFSLTGVRLGNDIDTLPRGIYVVGGKKFIKR